MKNAVIPGLTLLLSFCVSLTLYSATGDAQPPGDDTRVIQKAESEWKRGNFATSIELYQQLLDKYYFDQSKSSEFAYRIYSIYANELRDKEKAFKFLNLLMKQYSATSRGEEAYIRLAEMNYNDKNYFQSIQVLNRYLTIRNRITTNLYPKSLLMISQSYYKLNKFNEAVTYLAKLTAFTNSDKSLLYDGYYLQAYIFWEYFKDRETSYRALTRIFNLDIRKDNYDYIQLLFKKVRWQYFERKDGLKDDCVSAICFDGDDIWFGMWLGGVARYSRSRNQMLVYTVRDGLVSNYVRDIKVDADNVWIATFEGISRYDKRKSQWFKYTSIPGVGSQRIKSVLVQSDSVWFGTLGYGVERYLKAQDRWESLSDLPSNIVKIRQDPGSPRIGFASLNNGCLLYDGVRWTKVDGRDTQTLLRTVKDIAFWGETMYIATYNNGVYAYDMVRKTLSRLELFRDHQVYINTIAVRAGRLFIGTLGEGVYVFDPATSRLQQINLQDGLTSSNIMTIEFENDYIWFGTIDNGVDILYLPDPI